MTIETSVLVPQLHVTASPDPSELPVYNTLSLPDFPLDFDVNESDAGLPVYEPPDSSGNRNSSSSASRRLVEHKFTLPDSKRRQWLTLRVGSLAQTPTSLPNFYEGLPVAGVVELKLEKPDSISAIVISIKGAVVVSAVDIKPFLMLNQTLWDGTFGDPRIPQNAGEHRSETRSAKFTAKLLGSYSFPFSIQIPHETNVNRMMLKDLHLTNPVSLPPHLSERGCFSLIDYNLIVTVKRSGLFRVSDMLTTRFGYTPRSRSGSPSPLRQLSYQENIPVLGPSLDPDGWILFPPVNIRGTLFGTREVHVDCVFGLAKPLTYTRGSAIPCSLMLDCEDPQLFDLLSSRNSGVLQLFRVMNTRVTYDVGGKNAADATPTSDTPIGESCWFPHDATSIPIDTTGPRGRTLLGEIGIPSDARPSFTFGQSYVKYIVRLVPSEVPGFVPAGKQYPEVSIEVNTDYPIGPRPRGYLPPSYRRGSQVLPQRFDPGYG